MPQRLTVSMVEDLEKEKRKKKERKKERKKTLEIFSLD